MNGSEIDLALVGGTVYPSPTADPVRDGVVLIRGETIAAAGARAAIQIPGGVRSLDCTGLTITAGFWNSHVHFFERKWANAAHIPAPELESQLQDMLTRFGFTSVFDLSSPWDNTRVLRDRIESGEIAGPRIRSTGQGLLPREPGLPPEAVLNFMGLMKSTLPEAATAGDAAALCRRLLEEGVDAIKLFASAPSKSALSEDIIQAAVNEAHRAEKLVFVHTNTAHDVLAAVRNGADIVAHTTPASGPWDDTVLDTMAERGVALTPTLTIWKYFLRHDRLSIQEKSVSTAVGQLHAWMTRGGAVLFGTDLGAVEYDPAGEYVLMAEAGMNFQHILASLTTAPAERFGESDQAGRIAKGLRADLAIFEGDPLRDIRNLARVRYTLRSGGIIYQAK